MTASTTDHTETPASRDIAAQCPVGQWMTKTNMDLSELLAKQDGGDFLRAVAEAVLQLIMEADVEGLIGAGKHERADQRVTWRNGYRERALDTRLGTLNLKVPKLRQGSYFPGFLEPRKTSEKALVAVIQEAWIGGVSTRRVDELAQAMGLSGISKSTVSKLCKDIDERVGEFLNRPLTGDWPYVWLDATYLKVRQGGRIVSVAAIIAVAANTDGRREIIGLGLGPSEAETFWMDFLRGLKARGLDGTKLVISDAHSGLRAAIERVFEATWQRCRVHWMRNALAHVSRGQHTVVAAAIRQAFDQPDRKQAGETWRRVADQLRSRWPKPGEMDAAAFTAFLEDSLSAMAAVSVDGAIHFTCMDWRHMAELQAAGNKVYSTLKNLMVWAKTNGGMGSFYRSRHELVYVWKVGTAPHTNTFGLGEHGRYRTNVWDYPGVNSFGANQKHLELHPTVKPVALVADAIKDVTRRSEIVLDGFGGSPRCRRRLLRLGHAIFQHRHQHGTADAQHAVELRAVRARGDGRADPRQDRCFEKEGALDGRDGSLRLPA